MYKLHSNKHFLLLLLLTSTVDKYHAYLQQRCYIKHTHARTHAHTHTRARARTLARTLIHARTHHHHHNNHLPEKDKNTIFKLAQRVQPFQVSAVELDSLNTTQPVVTCSRRWTEWQRAHNPLQKFLPPPLPATPAKLLSLIHI